MYVFMYICIFSNCNKVIHHIKSMNNNKSNITKQIMAINMYRFLKYSLMHLLHCVPKRRHRQRGPIGGPSSSLACWRSDMQGWKRVPFMGGGTRRTDQSQCANGLNYGSIYWFLILAQKSHTQFA